VSNLQLKGIQIVFCSSCVLTMKYTVPQKNLKFLQQYYCTTTPSTRLSSILFICLLTYIFTVCWCKKS